MAEGLRNNLRLGSSQQHEAHEGMPQVMKADVFQASFLDYSSEVMAQHSGVNGPALSTRKDKIVQGCVPLSVSDVGE